MKKLIISIAALTVFQTATAATMAKCSLTNRPQQVSGLNILLDDKSAASSSYLFFRTSAKVRLEGNYSVVTKMETWFYGNDLNRPAGQRPVKIVTVTNSDSQFTAKAELRFESQGANSRVSGQLSVKDRGAIITSNQSIICDISNPLQE